VSDPLPWPRSPWLRVDPQRVAFDDGGTRVLRYGELAAATSAIAAELAAIGVRRIALVAENSIDAALLHLATLDAGIGLVPLPTFFSDEQLAHAIVDSGAELLLVEDAARLRSVCDAKAAPAPRLGSLSRFEVLELETDGVERPGFARLTYTSGTTGTPKGVMLSRETLMRVARSLAAVIELSPSERHVALLPLSILLEEVGGLLRTLLCGATFVVPPRENLGARGAIEIEPVRMLESLAALGATSVIAMPEVVDRWCDVVESGRAVVPAALRFVGVGGARVGVERLERASRLGFEVFEGYGLSEAASVVAVNRRGANRRGAVGRPLPHVDLRIAADGEILLRGALLDGYLNGLASFTDDGFLRTGDLGFVDDDGYLHLLGRRRGFIATSHGRKVDPAWLESLLTDGTTIVRAKVLGDGMPTPIAYVECRSDPETAARDVAAVNARLPEYARLHTIHVRSLEAPVSEFPRWVSFAT
jgi:long-chain acyl-CoA synthetase